MPQFNIALVGEAWGEQEEAQRMPFVGPAGFQLNSMLRDAGIERSECFVTNTFNFRPPKNDIDALCVSKSLDTSGLPPIRAGKYIRSEYLPELSRLYGELEEAKPNIVVALGGVATWALCHSSTISKARGATRPDHTGRFKVLPTYHPAAVLRQYELRAVTVLDLIKAKRESTFPEIRRPRREVWLEPSLEDIRNFIETYCRNARYISIDIETMGDQITCIGFAPTVDRALVIPFHDPRKSTGSYWPDLESERRAWELVDCICNLPAIKVFQNGLYDLHFLWRNYGIRVNNADADTMLLHHSLQPESPKGLDFLGSVYTDESAWKLMRQRGKTTIKGDE